MIFRFLLLWLSFLIILRLILYLVKSLANQPLLILFLLFRESLRVALSDHCLINQLLCSFLSSWFSVISSAALMSKIFGNYLGRLIKYLSNFRDFSNLSNTITALLLLVNATTAGNDLGGAEVRRIRTLAKYLDSENFGEPKNAITQGDDSLVTQGDDNLEFNDVVINTTADPNARFPDERWFIDRKSSETRDSVTFELASKFDLAGQKIPRRQIIANICQWKYRSPECSYAGTDYYDVNGNEVSTEAQDVCGKRVASCKLRFGENAELPFGSFPGAGLTK